MNEVPLYGEYESGSWPRTLVLNRDSHLLGYTKRERERTRQKHVQAPEHILPEHIFSPHTLNLTPSTPQPDLQIQTPLGCAKPIGEHTTHAWTYLKS